VNAKEENGKTPLVRDGEQKEYSAHLIPDDGFNKIARLVTDNPDYPF